MTTLTLVVLMLAGMGFFVRLVVGPSISDRIIGIEGLVVVGVSAIAVRAMQSGGSPFLPVLVLFTLVGFVGTVAAGRFVEREE